MTEAERAEYMLYRAVWSAAGDTKPEQVKAVTATHDFSDKILLSGLTPPQEELYNKYAKGNVDSELYLLASAFHGSAVADKDKNGESISGTKTAKNTGLYRSYEDYSERKEGVSV